MVIGIENIMRRLILLILLFLIVACGDKSYEDCLLSNLDSNKNQSAAMLIRESCRIKFPEKVQIRNEDGSVTEVDASSIIPIKEIKIGENHHLFSEIYFEITGEKSIEVTNRSNSTIKSISIGETSDSACSQNINDYNRFTTCKFYYAYDVLEPAQTKEIFCNNEFMMDENYCMVRVLLN